MALIGAEYLLNLAAIAVAFVGFSTVIVALRQAMGAELSKVHMHFVRLFIEGGLAVAVFSLLPAVLSYTGLPDSGLWRFSSAAAAVALSVYVLSIVLRRRRLSAGLISPAVIANVFVSALATLLLWANVAGFPFQPSAAPYLLALTWFLVLCGLIFLQNLDIFVRPPRTG